MAFLQDVSASSLNNDDPQAQIQSVVKQVNNAFREISNETRTKITNDDAGDGRLLQGYQQGGFENGNVGIKLSQTGVNVEEATDDQLIFSTDFNLFKIVSSGEASVTIPSSWASLAATTTTVAHNQSDTPAFIAYVTCPSFADFPTYSGATLPGLSSTPATIHLNTTGHQIYASARVDSTNIYFDVVNVSSLTSGWPAKTWTFKYYILKETAS